MKKYNEKSLKIYKIVFEYKYNTYETYHKLKKKVDRFALVNSRNFWLIKSNISDFLSLDPFATNLENLFTFSTTSDKCSSVGLCKVSNWKIDLTCPRHGQILKISLPNHHKIHQQTEN